MSLIRTTIFTSIFCIFSQVAVAQQCQMLFDEKTGLFTVNSNSKKLVSTHFSFWAEDWRWAAAVNKVSTIAPKSYEFATSVDKLSLDITGSAKVSEPNQINWDYSLQANKLMTDVIGGGIVFLLDFEDDQDINVELLPENTGWIMTGHPGCEQITVRFSRPLKKIYFERGSKKHIRAFFYDKNIIPDTTETRMTVTLPLTSEVLGTITEQHGGEPDFTWHKEMIHPNYSPVDLSYLNKNEIPSGKRGFLKSIDEKLVFEDGTEARFWGTNIQAYTIFNTSPSQIKTHAVRLSKLGFNLVRIHHHDSGWVRPNIFGNNASNTLNFNRESFKMIDLWIHTLKQEGIYVWLDLNVGRQYSAEDGINNFEEISKGKDRTTAKGFTYINDDIEQRMKEFNEEYLSHVNEYTGLAYKDDPAIISVLITNENDLTTHFGNSLLPDKKVPISTKKYMKLSNDFAAKSGLPKDQTWRSWEHGPAKIFLNDLEHQFNQRMISHLRSLGVKSQIATTNSWGEMPINSLPALTDSTLIDVHSYGRPDFLKTNPRVKDNFVNWIGASQVNGMPLSVTEWNVEPFPETHDRFASTVYVAALSAFQGWDAIMQYGYAQQPLNGEGRPSNYTTFNDPAAMVLMPASALLYREGHVTPANNTFAISLSNDNFFNEYNSPKNSASIRTLLELSKLVIDIPKTPELPWFEPVPLSDDVTKITDSNKDFIPVGQNFVRSDTGELTRNWQDGIYTINTDKTQIIMGWIGGKELSTDHVNVSLNNKNAAVAVQSLDKDPINTSENILISVATRTLPSEGKKMPFISEPAQGAITIAAKEGLKLSLLNKYGKELDIPFTYSDGRYQLLIDRKINSYWFTLKK